MEYTIQKLSTIAGISTRTLRYYDEIGLLKPARINSSGYRIYGKEEIETLQQILFYRELGVNLDTIMKILKAPDFDSLKSLKSHYTSLLEKRAQINLLIQNVEKTIAEKEGREIMSDKEKFEGFKQKLINENEEKYGVEIRQKYGEDTVNKSNQKLKNMSKEKHVEALKLEKQIHEKLQLAFADGNPSSALAQEVADLHRRWLSLYWDNYSKQAHAGLAQMYVDDKRFTAYYDKENPGTAKFLRDAIRIYTGIIDK